MILPLEHMSLVCMVLRREWRVGQLEDSPWDVHVHLILVFSGSNFGETVCLGLNALWFIISESKASVCSFDADRVFLASLPVFSPPWSVSFGGPPS